MPSETLITPKSVIFGAVAVGDCWEYAVNARNDAKTTSDKYFIMLVNSNTKIAKWFRPQTSQPKPSHPDPLMKLTIGVTISPNTAIGVGSRRFDRC